jgi:hypothetical protein
MWIAAALGVLALVGTGNALTQPEIDHAAIRAHQRLRTVVRKLAAPKFAGRDNDTPESLVIQTWLVRRLRRLGAGLNTAATGDDAYKQTFSQSGQSGTNLFAVIPGRELPGEYVIVGAHYDHLDSRSDLAGHCRANGAVGGEVCNGATDNAAGVGAVIAVGRALRRLPTPPRRSVVLALWDAEEDGLLGSRYYVNNPLVPLAATTAYVNFDIQGANLLPSLRQTSFAVGGETGGSVLQGIVDQAVAAESLGTRQVSYIFGQYRSDYFNFGNAGVPTIFFSDSTGGCYHTVRDDPAVVDFRKLRTQSHIAFRTTVSLAETTTPPTFAPTNPDLAVYADLLVVAGVVQAALADLSMLTPADQSTITAADATFQQLIADGPAAFDSNDALTLLTKTVDLVDILTRIPCARY